MLIASYEFISVFFRIHNFTSLTEALYLPLWNFLILLDVKLMIELDFQP